MKSSPEVAARRALDRLISTNRLPGIQYVVVDAQGVRFEYCGGMRDLEANAPVTPETTFMASSSTKVITAAALLQLVDAGKIRLDDALTSHYAAHPYGGAVTIRHLVSQTSGIPNPMPLRWIHRASDVDRFDEDGALCEVLRRHPKLKHAPGTAYGYSNISYWLLGKVIESVSKCSYASYVTKRILEPLGVTSIQAGFIGADVSRRAVGYQKAFSPSGVLIYLLMDRSVLGHRIKGRISVLPVQMNGPAYGGLICTAGSLGRFLQDVLREKSCVMSGEAKRLFFEPQRTNAGNATGMTLGFRLGRLRECTYFGKPGGGPGFQSNVRIYPEQRIGVAWLANQTGLNASEMNRLSDDLDAHWLS